MKCIYCSGETKVTNSRLQKKQNQVWRRRQCLECQAVFSTAEGVTGDKSIVVQSGNAFQPFSRDKLLLSLHASLKHRKTAVSDATALTGTVLSRLYPQIADASLQRGVIVSTTHQILKRFDKAAATAYLAYHPL